MLELTKLLEHHARYRPDVTAVICEDQRLSYAEFWARVARSGNLLRSAGIGRGDKVATVAANSLDLLELYWAVPTIGAVLVPLSPLLLAPGLASLLRGADARCVIADSALAAVLREIGDGLPRDVFLIGGGSPEFRDYRALAASQDERLVPSEADDGDLFNIMFTSGTTGQPKGIMHTHFIRAMYATLMANAFRITPESRTLHAGAIVFNGAFCTLMPTFYLGATYILHRQFDARAAIETIERERVTHTMMVPAQIVAMLASDAFDPRRLQSLQCVLSLGAPLLQKDKDQLNEALPGRLYELYGLTEGFVTILDRSDAVRKAGSVGAPPPFFEVRIVRDDGQDAVPGEVGEILGKGPIRMTGYYGRPDLTAQAVRDGWIHSGDVGYLDDEGFLFLIDRKKDMIDSGGVKVYPRDVEEVAAGHPAVQEVAVFGVPHEKWGETPVAAVILRPGHAVAPEELRDWINERVGARYQRVSKVLLMTEFPRSAAGKTLKREMRAPFWADQGRTI
jgi:long-chain acyl-CoA synthetase